VPRGGTYLTLRESPHTRSMSAANALLPTARQLDRCLGRSSRTGRGSIFPNSDQRLPGQLLRQDTPSTRASTIAALQRVRHPPGCSDAACASASHGRSLK
jgi:hypothetical protein